MTEKIQNITEKDYDSAKTEYIILRKELQSYLNNALKIETTLFSVYSLILAYLLSSNTEDPLSYLTPIPLIIIFYKLRYNTFLGIWKIAAYCSVFFPEYGFLWEKRLISYRDLNKIFEDKSSKIYREFNFIEIYYLCLCFICFILFLYKGSEFEWFSFKTIISIILCLCLILAVRYRKIFGLCHYAEFFKENIEKWNEVKNKEILDKNNNNHIE